MLAPANPVNLIVADGGIGAQVARPAKRACHAGIAAEAAPPPPKPAAAGISSEAARSLLGEHSYATIKRGITMQQETFSQQVWELNRLAHTQLRRAMLATDSALLASGASSDPCAPCNPFRSCEATRELQRQALTAILVLPSVPKHLRGPGALFTLGPSVCRSQNKN